MADIVADSEDEALFLPASPSSVTPQAGKKQTKRQPFGQEIIDLCDTDDSPVNIGDISLKFSTLPDSSPTLPPASSLPSVVARSKPRHRPRILIDEDGDYDELILSSLGCAVKEPVLKNPQKTNVAKPCQRAAAKLAESDFDNGPAFVLPQLDASDFEPSILPRHNLIPPVPFSSIRKSLVGTGKRKATNTPPDSRPTKSPKHNNISPAAWHIDAIQTRDIEENEGAVASTKKRKAKGKKTPHTNSQGETTTEVKKVKKKKKGQTNTADVIPAKAPEGRPLDVHTDEVNPPLEVPEVDISKSLVRPPLLDLTKENVASPKSLNENKPNQPSRHFSLAVSFPSSTKSGNRPMMDLLRKVGLHAPHASSQLSKLTRIVSLHSNRRTPPPPPPRLPPAKKKKLDASEDEDKYDGLSENEIKKRRQEKREMDWYSD